MSLPNILLPQPDAFSDWKSWARALLVELEQYDAQLRATIEPLVEEASGEDQQLKDILDAP